MKKSRKDCFLGIHFDFHAMEGEIVAHHFDPDVFREMLDRVKPDFMQFDTKGHAGFSSYPTKVGTQAAEIRQDMLAFLREETAKRGILLYGHHSGLFDMQVLRDHPDWAVIHADGTRSDRFISSFSPYVDEILIPQLKELALNYRLDGAWIDGECWAVCEDYSPWAMQAYELAGGCSDHIDSVQHREFCRQGFFHYVTHYTDEIKAVSPDFEITSNWIFSPYMADPICSPVDFLSGDYDCANAVASARRNGRYLAARGITWDLMSWGQNAIPLSWMTKNRTTKSAVQYMQEASYIVALGGGFQFFNIAYCHGGYIQRWALPIWEDVANFCRERQLCYGTKPWSNIALVMPYVKKDDEKPSLFGPTSATKAFMRWLDALCEIQLSPCIIFESELDKTNLSQYDLVILPQEVKLPESYGGKVIVDGVADAEARLLWLSDTKSLAAMEVPYSQAAGRPFGECYTRNYFEHDSEVVPSAFKQNGCYRLGFNFAQAYQKNITPTICNWLRMLLADTGVDMPVKVQGSGFVEVITTRKGDDLLVNLINMCGDHRRAEVRVYDEIPPLYNLTVQVGEETRTVDRLDIHEVLIFKNYFS